LDSANLHQGETGLDPDDFQNSVELFCPKILFDKKILMKMWSIFPQIWAKLYQISYLSMSKNP